MSAKDAWEYRFNTPGGYVLCVPRMGKDGLEIDWEWEHIRDMRRSSLGEPPPSPSEPCRWEPVGVPFSGSALNIWKRRVA